MPAYSRRVVMLHLCLLFSACGILPGSAEAPFSKLTVNDEVMGKWARSCALCHINGEAGAPKVGDVSAWAPRLAQGEDVVMRHVIEGFNSMPPLGYCMSCEEDDFKRMVAYMAGLSQAGGSR